MRIDGARIPAFWYRFRFSPLVARDIRKMPGVTDALTNVLPPGIVSTVAQDVVEISGSDYSNPRVCPQIPGVRVV
jgi:hypothetical protein